MSKTPTCANCYRSLFRNMHGVTVLYCGYYLNPTLFDHEACVNWRSEKPKNK